jgi:predicted metal-dependent phosphoesterase TrpH
MKGDIHIHSKYSPDSISEPEKIMITAKHMGLDFIAISDHNKFRLYSGDIIVLPAEEVSSLDGHILALFIDGEIQKGLSQAETVEAIHDKNGIAICAHPYRKVNGIGSKFLNIYDAIEVKNGRCMASCNSRSELLSRNTNKPRTAGSDAHFYEEIGRVFMEAEATDQESLRKAILAGNVKIFGEDLSLQGQFELYMKLGKEYVLRGFKRI